VKASRHHARSVAEVWNELRDFDAEEHSGAPGRAEARPPRCSAHELKALPLSGVGQERVLGGVRLATCRMFGGHALIEPRN